MVELVLSTLDEELLPHCYVAMRVGDSQKIGRLSAERMYKFPETTVGEHKYAMLDVFQRVGGCTVSIKPKDGDQDLQVKTKAGNLNLRVSKPGYKEKLAKKDPAAVEDAPLLKPKFEAAKEYLRKHNLEARLKDAMKAVINDLPEDPVGFIATVLRDTDDPTVIQVPANVALSQTREAFEKAAKDGTLAHAAQEAAKGESRHKDLRSEVRQALLDSSYDGSLPKALQQLPIPFSQYYSNHFKGSQNVTKLATKLFKVPELKEPPSTMTDEEALEFKKQIQERAGELSEDDLMQSKAAFTHFENTDGTIKYRNMPQALQTLNITFNPGELDKLMDDVGVDENGKISFPEFLDFVVEKREEEAEIQEVIKAFKTFDRRGTGCVRIEDLRMVMTSLGEGFSQEEIEAMIKEAPGATNGQINYAEFARRMIAAS